MNTISFRYNSCHYDIILDKLPDAPIRNVKKLFFLMCSRAYNDDTIRITDDFIKSIVPDCKNDWEEKSVAFQRGFVDTKYRSDLDKHQRAQIKANNDRLYSDVKKAKKLYEKWVKIQDQWAEAKEKYFI